MDLEVPKIQTGFFAVRADFAPFPLTNDDKKRRYVNDTFDANSMAQTRCYVNDTVNGVRQSIRQPGPLFSATNFIKANSRRYQLAKSWETELRRDLFVRPIQITSKLSFPRARDIFLDQSGKCLDWSTFIRPLKLHNGLNIEVVKTCAELSPIFPISIEDIFSILIQSGLFQCGCHPSLDIFYIFRFKILDSEWSVFGCHP